MQARYSQQQSLLWAPDHIGWVIARSWPFTAFLPVFASYISFLLLFFLDLWAIERGLWMSCLGPSSEQPLILSTLYGRAAVHSAPFIVKRSFSGYDREEPHVSVSVNTALRWHREQDLSRLLSLLWARNLFFFSLTLQHKVMLPLMQHPVRSLEGGRRWVKVIAAKNGTEHRTSLFLQT